MGTYKIKQKIAKLLEENGEMTFTRIQDFLNENSRHGTTAQELCNILAKDARFFKSGHERKESILSGGYAITVWRLAKGED
jgi:hypothetical protein